ncbi:zinc finger and btb domain-containing protein 44, partial [Lynx pardinus]
MVHTNLFAPRGVRFPGVQNLNQHILIRSGIGPFRCDRCGTQLTRAYLRNVCGLECE